MQDGEVEARVKGSSKKGSTQMSRAFSVAVRVTRSQIVGILRRSKKGKRI